MEALLWWRGHPELFNRLLFATDFLVPFWTPPWSLFLSRADYSRFTREHNPFDRMAVLLKGLGVYPPADGFESLVQHSRLMAEQRVLPSHRKTSGHS